MNLIYFYLFEIKYMVLNNEYHVPYFKLISLIILHIIVYSTAICKINK